MRLDAHNIAKFNPRSHPTFLFSHFELLGGVKLFNKKMPKKVRRMSHNSDQAAV
jgi:hypothetical protein